MNIRLKAVFATMIIFTVVLVLFISYAFQYLSQAREAELAYRSNEVAELVAFAVEVPMEENDLNTLHQQAERFIQHSDLAFLTIERDGRVLAHTQRSDTQMNDVTIAKYPIGSPDDKSGDVIIGFRNHHSDAVASPIGQFLIWSSSGIGLLAIATMYIMMLAVTRPLRKLQKLSKKDSVPSSFNMFFQDEIEATVDMVNSMQKKLDKSYQQLQNSIRDQKYSYVEAQQIEEKNVAIYNASLDAIVVANDQDIIIEFNAIAEQLFGWDRDEIVGRRLADTLIPPALRESHIKGMQHFLASGEGPVLNQRIELPAVRKSGREFPIEVSISPAKTKQGYIFVSYMRDITQRLKDQTELKIAAHAFESSEAMFISDAKGHIIRTNPAFTSITGFESAEVEGEKPRTLSANPEDIQFHKQIWRTLIDSGRWNGEISLRHRDGNELPVRMSMTAVRDEDDTLTHYVAHFFDLTEQKHNERILRTAQHEAESANESKSRFLATMSHEIRTPMNSVLGVLGLLKETPLNIKQLGLVQTARESGELLLAIINDVLDFSKMEAGKLTLEKNPFDIVELLQQTLDILRPQAANKNLKLNVIFADNTPQYLIGDGDRIRQIVLNLMSNAIKYTQEGSITVSIKCARLYTDACQLQIDVSDTGQGIDQGHITDLFDEFTMAEDTYDRRHEGSGLGLAICKQLVNLMKGKIEVDSQKDVGSTFTLTLELKLAEKEDCAPLSTSNPTLGGTAEISSSMRILLAEDNPANQVVLRTMLEFSGLSADIVSNGQEAVDAVSKIPYDIIFMDISMPEMDGVEATQRIRQMDSPTKDVIIVALTAHAIRGDKEHFLNQGMDDFVSKPVTRQSILDCLGRWQDHASKTGSERDIIKHQTSSARGQGDANNGPGSATDCPPQNELVDESTLQQLVSDTSAEAAPNLISFYIEDAKTRVLKLVDAAESEDFYTLEFEAHTLGSSAAAHGNAALCKLCRSIEAFCLEQAFDKALDTATQLAVTADASFEALDKRLQRGLMMK
ncbi:PAS domain S-box protein [Enterovibrio norvegicus]|uniref:PAS domain S-box protein n=1 Tax=Enterovibrio norvegicus TaxID=188144 RepID=UPI001F52C201|nr:PAS domain S-box protein [Enterovibrio norvegicus]